MSTDTPSPATPAPTDRGERMSTPTPDQPADGLYVRTREQIAESMGEWGLGFDLEDEHDGPSLMRVVMAHVEPIIQRLRKTEVRLEGLRQTAASAPQGDTADVTERAAKIAHDRQCGCSDYQEHADEDTSYVEMMGAVAAAGLLAVAASPAAPQAAEVAQAFHEAYERLAPSFGYETRKASAKPWSDVPEPNRSLMTAVAGEVLASLSAPAPADDEVAQHVIEFRENGWTIMHPLSCRPALFDCPVNRAAEDQLDQQPDVLGRFVVELQDGELVVGEPADESTRAALAALKEGQR